jgi:hypothetical protein
MMARPRRAGRLLLAGFLGALAASVGILPEFSSWHHLPGIDPALLPFLILPLAGFLGALVGPLTWAVLSGVATGFIEALSGTAYHLLSGGVVAEGAPTVIAYLVIMSCLGALFGLAGALPVCLYRFWKVLPESPPLR